MLPKDAATGNCDIDSFNSCALICVDTTASPRKLEMGRTLPLLAREVKRETSRRQPGY